MVDSVPEAIYLVQATPEEAARFGIGLRKPNVDCFITMEAVDLTITEVDA